MVIGKNGIIKQAERAKEFYVNGEAADNAAMDTYEQIIANARGVTLEEAKADSMLTKTENTELKIGDDTVWIPAGFKVHEDTAETVDEGIVITDGTNEFVWVPVSDESFANMFSTAEPAVALSGETGVTSNYYSNLRVRSAETSTLTLATVSNGAYSSTSAIREPDLATDLDETETYYTAAGFTSAQDMAQAFVDDYTNMRASIEKYDGFYIGRYELTGTVDSPTVQSGTVLTASTSQAGSWYGLYKACRNVVTDNSKVTTTMIWGCQWDETMNWLKNTEFKDNPDAVDTDSSSWGNYSSSTDNAAVLKEDGTAVYGTEQITGYSEYWSANKIYDLAGNYWDWTQEVNGSFLRVWRGRFLL